MKLKRDENGIILFVIIVLVAMISLLVYRVMSANSQADTDNNPNTNTIEEAQKVTDDTNEDRQKAGEALDSIR